jgi:hypothetical protein
MKILQKASLTLIAGFAAFLAATTAHAQNLRAFEATSHQNRLVSIVCNGDVCDIVFEGTGTANIMGPVTVTIHVVEDYSGYPCDPYTAETTLVGATGSITISDTAGWVCASPGHGTIQGVWNVTGGTGQFSGIVGSGADQGTFTGNGPNVRWSGIVVY